MVDSSWWNTSSCGKWDEEFALDAYPLFELWLTRLDLFIKRPSKFIFSISDIYESSLLGDPWCHPSILTIFYRNTFCLHFEQLKHYYISLNFQFTYKTNIFHQNFIRRKSSPFESFAASDITWTVIRSGFIT